MIAELWHGLHDLLSGLLQWVESFADRPSGSWVLLGISFAESSFFPVPPDVLLIALCLARPEHSLWFAAICATGSVLGGMFGYGIGWFGGRPILQRLFSAQKIANVKRLYDKYNAWATGIAGLTPLPYKIFTIGGGTFGVNFKVFVLASIIGRSLRFFAVAGLIFWIGEPAKLFIAKYLNVLSIAFVVLLVGSFLIFGKWLQRSTDDAGGAEVETDA